MKITIRPARDNENDALTNISFTSKNYWNYPQEYFDVWRRELTITSDYINTNIVFVAEVDEIVAGYFSIAEVKEDFFTGQVMIKKGFWLEHLFILPEFIGQGIGTDLMFKAKNICAQMKIDRLYIFSDPNAKGFYDKLGAKYIGESPSSIEGRMVSLFELEVNLI
ncbi:putative acetyltransferase [Desulfosporosinus orientis DSM 765]|uniref:Putative acetyltransferase n=1 Tax=Desulfosporosinus orientis (strain ATCC 19365 / DSM 765 / NCIMB 8382 / VKM B-1628 / Singapore I) TaxID=768706 RepID=G7W9I1_DESOD|nr:GNAT family N-acetyltransferase [Desulfosporosinus orientis]AET69898.1 putative acetyltransferase [Desulfosporosinus orientis DSM 765]